MSHQMAPQMTFSNPTAYMWTPSSCRNSQVYQWTSPMTSPQINSVHSPPYQWTPRSSPINSPLSYHPLHCVPQSLHNEQWWSTTSLGSGLASFNGEQPIRRDETYPGSFGAFPSTNGSESEGNTLQQPLEEKNTHSGQAGFPRHVDLMTLTSYTDSSSRLGSMSPLCDSLWPQLL